MFLDQGVEEVIESSFHDFVELVERQIDAMVGDTVLRVVIGSDAFGAVAAADLQLAGRGAFVDSSLARLVKQADFLASLRGATTSEALREAVLVGAAANL